MSQAPSSKSATVSFDLDELADPKLDHFARLQLERDPVVCPTTLEIRYLRASRAVHPDAHATSDSAAKDEAKAIDASALLNEAQRTLASPWQRYPYLANLLHPGVMDETKQLDPAFLMEAMELGEEVDEARHDSEATRHLKRRIEGELVDYAHRVEALLRAATAESVRNAARLCHEAKYLQRALEVLEREEQDGIPD